MAYQNKVGTLLRQGIYGSSALNGQPSMLNLIRCMSTKLFIAGLSFRTDEQRLREAFSSFGDVVDAKVITDRDTRRSRRFGFVNFSSDESASSALSAMDGQQLNGRNIKVSYALERPPRRVFNNADGFGDGF